MSVRIGVSSAEAPLSPNSAAGCAARASRVIQHIKRAGGPADQDQLALADRTTAKHLFASHMAARRMPCRHAVGTNRDFVQRHRIDVVHWDELQNDAVPVAGRQPFHFVGSWHVSIGGVLVTLSDFRCVHGAVHRAAFLVLDASAAVSMNLIELDGGCATVSGKGFDGDRHQAEAKQPRPARPSAWPDGFAKAS